MMSYKGELAASPSHIASSKMLTPNSFRNPTLTVPLTYLVQRHLQGAVAEKDNFF